MCLHDDPSKAGVARGCLSRSGIGAATPEHVGGAGAVLWTFQRKGGQTGDCVDLRLDPRFTARHTARSLPEPSVPFSSVNAFWTHTV